MWAEWQRAGEHGGAFRGSRVDISLHLWWRPNMSLKNDSKMTYCRFKDSLKPTSQSPEHSTVCSATVASPLMLNYPALITYSLYSRGINGKQHVVSRETLWLVVSASSLLWSINGAARMMYFCRLTWKLAPACSFDKKHVVLSLLLSLLLLRKFMMHKLFSDIIVTSSVGFDRSANRPGTCNYDSGFALKNSRGSQNHNTKIPIST